MKIHLRSFDVPEEARYAAGPTEGRDYRSGIREILEDTVETKVKELAKEGVASKRRTDIAEARREAEELKARADAKLEELERLEVEGD